MVHPNKKRITALIVILCLVGIVSVVVADMRGEGTIHPDFTVSNGLDKSGGWATTGVRNPDGNHRPQAFCELQNAAGQQISRYDNWGDYGIAFANASCPNQTGSLSLRLWVTHGQWIGANQYYWKDMKSY